MKSKRCEIRLNEFEYHVLDVLKNTYKIKPSDFIRQAIIEKAKKDGPKMREKFIEEKTKLPF